MNITVSPEFVERREDDPNRRIEFVVRKSGLAERAVEVIAFTRNSSLTGTYWCECGLFSISPVPLAHLTTEAAYV